MAGYWRSASTTEDLFFSTRNLVVVLEELTQFNDLLKMLLGRHDENNALMEDKASPVDEDLFDDLGSM